MCEMCEISFILSQRKPLPFEQFFVFDGAIGFRYDSFDGERITTYRDISYCPWCGRGLKQEKTGKDQKPTQVI